MMAGFMILEIATVGELNVWLIVCSTTAAVLAGLAA